VYSQEICIGHSEYAAERPNTSAAYAAHTTLHQPKPSVLTYAAHFRVEQLPGQLEELLEVGQRV
jgi:hypothetical protein